ncbi:MAG TPA: hypothetical protein VIM11_16210 [Tepidisphaeraceae bacterium]|jgi:hypothetical protein
MTITISISPNAESRLRERAEASGQAMEAYIAQVVELAASSSDVDELLAPFRQQVAESGMSDEELDDFFEGLRAKAFQERQRRPA